MQAALLVGGPGTAKTTIVKHFLRSFVGERTTVKTMTFSHFTTPEMFQKAIEVGSAVVLDCVQTRDGGVRW